MAWTIEAARKGGQVTLERYGREHFRRITKGRKPRPRYKATPDGDAAERTTPTGRRLYVIK